MTHCNSEAIATNDINYSCCVKVVELGSPIIWTHITPLVINSLGADTLVPTFQTKDYLKQLPAILK